MKYPEKMTANDYYKDVVSILVLDYNKPIETRMCLESIKKYCKFNYEVILYSNGGEQDYVLTLYNEGLIDKCIFSSKNVGCGLATVELFKSSMTQYSIYLQNDQAFFRDVSQKYIDDLIKVLEESRPNEFNQVTGSISLAGAQCGPFIYSERAHIIKTDFYNTIPKTIGGPGPLNDVQYSEEAVQNYYKNLNYLHAAVAPCVVDNGKYSIRELAGGITKWRTDTKQLWVLHPPTQKVDHLELNDEEWDTIIKGEWEDGKIPDSWQSHSFVYWEEE